MIQKNPLAMHKNNADKTRDFVIDCRNGVLAYRDDNSCVPLTDVNFKDVEFIGGLWRVQRHIDYELAFIRDAYFVMGPRIDVTEKNYFEYYQIARAPVFNCYGPIGKPVFNMVASRYKTDDGEYWGYGKDVAAARAFLGIRLYDTYMDLIHSAACRGRSNQKR